MFTLSRQPQIKSRNFIGQYDHNELMLNVFGTFDDAGNFSLEAIGVAGTTIDISNAISDELDAVIIGWAEFMAPTWKRESAQQQRIDQHLWAREMAVAF
jgi:hypothetical protein